jgi:cobalt-zinc-cadmium efflux system protein
MEHTHRHVSTLPSVRITHAFVMSIVFNSLIVVVEFAAGLIIKSLTLLSDAIHNLADVGVLSLSLFAYRMLSKGTSEQYTYGYSKTSILVAFFNAVVLMVSVGAIVFEAARRLLAPQPVQGVVISIIAGIAIFVNFFTALPFFREKNKDLNIKSAYLHLLSDAGVSLGIVAGGIIIIFTSWYWIDSLFGMIISVIIMISTWRLLRDSFRLSMDGVPRHIDITDLRKAVMNVPGVKDFHHIHVWGISTSENALTAHVVLDMKLNPEDEHSVKIEIRNILEHYDIHHITLETERENDFPAF